MTKRLVEVTDPLGLELAKEIKRDVEERGSKTYLTCRKVNGIQKYIVWREPDEEDRKNRIGTKAVSTKKLFLHNLKSLA